MAQDIHVIKICVSCPVKGRVSPWLFVVRDNLWGHVMYSAGNTFVVCDDRFVRVAGAILPQAANSETVFEAVFEAGAYRVSTCVRASAVWKVAKKGRAALDCSGAVAWNFERCYVIGYE